MGKRVGWSMGCSNDLMNYEMRRDEVMIELMQDVYMEVLAIVLASFW